MTEDLTSIDGVGSAIADELRDAGYTTADDVREATVDELADVHLLGEASATAILEDEDDVHGGRPSKFEQVKDDLLEAAESFLNLKQVANKGGVSRSTLYKYLDEHEEFSDSFKRARARAADQLVQRALDPEDDIDTTFARFLLERSFKFIKTERQEVDLNADHSFDASEGVTAEFVSYEEAGNGNK
ncbi:helix-hairpin-helix domain-containing protein [Halorussus marinus]|uniref:helix-hairpin-helix domain-containing protein n=1 Tax=Halorussus marinus TaxID=2505976 RepID=UPI001092F1B8|nr:helix-hairpin-helix domain-containing protein [Halorussus marinus]